MLYPLSYGGEFSHGRSHKNFVKTGSKAIQLGENKNMAQTKLVVNTNSRQADAPNGAALVGLVIAISCGLIVIALVLLVEYTLQTSAKPTK